MSTYLFSELFPEENRPKITSINNSDYGIFRSMSAPFSQDNNDSHKWLEASVIAGNPYKWQITSCTVLNGDIVSSSPEDYPPLCLVDAISVLSEFEESRRILKLPLIDSNHLFPGQSEIPAHYAKVARDSHITLENGHPSFPNLKKQPPTPKDAQAAKEAFKNALFAYDALKESGNDGENLRLRNDFITRCAEDFAPNIDDDDLCNYLFKLSIEALSDDVPEIEEGGIKLAKNLIENNPNRLSSFMAAAKEHDKNDDYSDAAMYFAFEIVNFSKDPKLAEEAFDLLQNNNHYSNIVDYQHKKLAKVILDVNPALSDRAIKLACDNYTEPYKRRWLDLGDKALEVNPSLINKFMDLMDEAVKAPIYEHPHVLSLINKALDISNSSEIAQRSVTCVRDIIDIYQPKDKFTKLETLNDKNNHFIIGNYKNGTYNKWTTKEIRNNPDFFENIASKKARALNSLPMVKTIIDKALNISAYNAEKQNDVEAKATEKALEVIGDKTEKTGIWQSLAAIFSRATYMLPIGGIKSPKNLHSEIIADAAYISNELTQWHYGEGAHYLCYINSKALTAANDVGFGIFKSLLDNDPSYAQDLLDGINKRNTGEAFEKEDVQLFFKYDYADFDRIARRAGNDNNVSTLFNLHELSNIAKLHLLLLNSDASRDVLNNTIKSANGFKNIIKKSGAAKPDRGAFSLYRDLYGFLHSKTEYTIPNILMSDMGDTTPQQRYLNQVEALSKATEELEAKITTSCSNMLGFSYSREAELPQPEPAEQQ